MSIELRKFLWLLLACLGSPFCLPSAHAAAPTILNLEPAAETVVSELSFITVTFDVAVTGVDPADLLINETPATNINIINPREYTFYFPRPATGMVEVAWIENHGITDLSPELNPFGGGSWSYTYETNAGPTAVIVISEFLASNTSGIRDDEGSRQDWIELLNMGPVEQNLDGWFLTDTTNDLTQWRLPPVILQPNKYLLIWASAKDHRDPGAPLHTNFKIKNEGGFLALLDSHTNVVSSFDPYPAQQANISYGRDRADAGLLGYFATPTPGADNVAGGPGFAPEPVFSIDSGVFTNNSLSLTLSNTGSGVIRFTTDGTVPATNSPIYTNAITISVNAVIKARLFPTNGNLFPSRVVAKTYLLLDATVRDFTSNLPVLILDSRIGIPASVAPGEARAKGSFLVFEPQGGRTSFRATPTFQGLAEFEIFGQTSAGFPKLPYNIEIQDELNNDREVSFFGFPADADWKLRNPYTDKCLMNDFLAYELFEQMGRYSVRRKFVEVFVHQGPSKLTLSDYHGVEVFLEKIETGNGRVEIAKLTAAMTNEPAISGGYMFKKDKDSAGDLNFNTTGAGGFGGQLLKIHEPKPREITGTQLGWLTNYLNRMESSMYAANWLTATGTNHYSYYLDADAFVDQFWIVEFPKQIDGYRLSDYFQKDRNGKVKPEPIWDWNLSFGNADYLDGGHFSTWYYTLASAGDHIWARRLITGSGSATTIGDPDFCQKVADRWGVLRTNVMNGPRLLARIDEIAAQLTEAAQRDFAKFPRLGTYIWPNPGQTPGAFDMDYVHPTNYVGIIAEMKKWVNGRYNWVESQFTAPPVFSRPGGVVTNGTTITLTAAPGATIYYKLDGTDPRAPGGAVAAGAVTYSGPITINSNVRIFARAKKPSGVWQNTWSGPAAESYATALPGLRITEIMYHPADPAAGNTNDADNFEYVEVQNISGADLNLSGFSLGGGIQFQFPNITLAAGQYAVVVRDTNAFIARYGSSTLILGTFSGHLDNAGDSLVLSGPLLEPIVQVSYSDDWYKATDGAGFSLVIGNANGPAESWGLPASWRASSSAGGSPGGLDPAPPPRPTILVNEVLSYGDPEVDVIELYNPTANDVNIGTWYLSDDFDTPRKFRIPVGRTIPAHEFITFTEADFNNGGPNSFALGSKGDEVYLFSGDGVDLTGYVHGFDFGDADLGVTFGRYVDSTGDDHFVAQAANTLGLANSGPLVGPVVISEISYHPADWLYGNGWVDNQTDEYIELQNITDAPVNLYDASYPSNTWHLRNAVDFDFPSGVTIPAGGFVLVVGFNPADVGALNGFRARTSTPNSIPVYGPWSGLLQNDNESIELRKPRAPETNGSVPSVLVERVSYRDTFPWPEYADGLGLTLQRIVANSFGNDPSNWVASASSPGSVYVPAVAPVITGQSGDLLVAEGDNLLLNATASGPSPLRYQWFYQGRPLSGATNASQVISNLQTNQGGVFNIMVYNGGGPVFGTNFTVTTRVKLRISSQPVSRSNILATSSISFAVAAAGSGPTRYQWYFGSTPILNATNATHNIASVQGTNEGSYFCSVSDDYDVLSSAIVWLTVITKPVITFQPVNAYSLQGGNAVFTIAASGTPPISFRWRTNFFVVNSGIVMSGPTNSIFIMTNLSFGAQSNRITVTVTNLAGSVTSATATNFMLADFDRDGLPDAWEVLRGFNTNNAADGLADNDNDGMSNAAEWLAGTDYSNSNSFLRVQTALPGVGRLQFTAVSNRTYCVQYTDILPPIWTRLEDIPAGNTTRTETVIDRGSTSNRFYRLIIPAQGQ